MADGLMAALCSTWHGDGWLHLHSMTARNKKSSMFLWVASFWAVPRTCVPDVLNPHIGAGSEEQPVDWNEQETDHVAGESNADEKYWKRLKIFCLKQCILVHNSETSPVLDTWSCRRLILRATRMATGIQTYKISN